MPESIDTQIFGIDFQLWSFGGAYLHDLKTLFVADTHFGKEATFRRHSIPVPTGSTTETLSKISRMLVATGAKSLVILGDMFHARSSLSSDVCNSLDAFFTNHRNLDVALIRGNHDAGLVKLPRPWPVKIFPPMTMMGTIALAHHPDELPESAALLLCGHIHPSIVAQGAGDAIRCRCFWLTQQRLVFPAIGQFTGSANIRLRGSDQAWILAEHSIVEWRSE